MSSSVSSPQSQSPAAGAAHAVAVPDDCCILGQILIDIGAADLLQTFLDDGDNDSTLQALSEMGPKKLSRLYGMTQELAESFIQNYRIISEQRIKDAERARDAAEAQAAAAARAAAAAAAAAAEADGEDDVFGDFDSAPPSIGSGEEAGAGALPGDAEPSVDCGGEVGETGTGEDAKAAERARDAAEAQAAAAARAAAAAAAAAAEADGEDDVFGDFDSALPVASEISDPAICLSVSGALISSDSLVDAFSDVSCSVVWDDQATQLAVARQQDQVYVAVSEEIEFDLDSGFGDFSSSLDTEQQYASADVIVVDGGGFLQSGDESDNSDEFGEFINHEEAQRMLLCPTSLQTAAFGSSAEKVCVLSCKFNL
jgi:hypothetical protein